MGGYDNKISRELTLKRRNFLQKKKKKKKKQYKKKEQVYTESFWTKQTFGAASKVKKISTEEYLKSVSMKETE